MCLHLSQFSPTPCLPPILSSLCNLLHQTWRIRYARVLQRSLNPSDFEIPRRKRSANYTTSDKLFTDSLLLRQKVQLSNFNLSQPKFFSTNIPFLWKMTLYFPKMCDQSATILFCLRKTQAKHWIYFGLKGLSIWGGILVFFPFNFTLLPKIIKHPILRILWYYGIL